MQNEYLKVSEVALIVGKSTQSIYKMLPTTLATYVIVKGNQKFLKREVIKDIYDIDLDEIDIVNTSVSNEFDAVGNQVDNRGCQPIDNVANIIQLQLTTKDNQIKALTNQVDLLMEEINKQNTHSRETTKKLMELIEQVNELQRNNQLLLAQQNQVKKLENTDDEKKNSFWSRLRKRKDTSSTHKVE